MSQYLIFLAVQRVFFDIIQYNEITNENLINHIDNEGKLLYTKK